MIGKSQGKTEISLDCYLSWMSCFLSASSSVAYLSRSVRWGKTTDMASNPTSAPSAPDPTVSDLLKFARETAASEIANIERLHNKTLLSLTIIVSVFGLISGFLGWLGYDHLRDAAIGVARTQMQETVSSEVAKLMDKGHVDDAVKGVLEKRAEADLVAIINQHVGEEIKKLGPDIDRTVREDTTNAVKRDETANSGASLR